MCKLKRKGFCVKFSHWDYMKILLKGTIYKLPCTNYQCSTNYHVQTTNVQTTMYKLPCTNYHVQTTNVQTTMYKLPMYKLPCTNYHVQTTMYKLPCTNYHVQYKGIRKSELVTKTQFLWFVMVNGLSEQFD